MLENPGIVVDVCRKTLPALKSTALKDFLDLLELYGLYNKNNFNKSELIYKLGGSEICFFSVDQEQKVKGRKRDILWMNEANEFKHSDFKQLSIRTRLQTFMDYNPSDTQSWIYDHVHTRKDIEIIKSTYLDNPFLDQNLIEEIESYRDTDENFWRIYGLGEKGVAVSKVYSKWDYCDELPSKGETVYGLDFGYNHPTVLTKITNKDDEYYIKEELYVRFKTNSDLIDLMDEAKVSKKICIYADSAEPQRIKEIQRAGYFVKPAYKGAGSVKNGIDFCKRHKIHLTKDSTKGAGEMKTYSWKTKEEEILDEPVKIKDDFCDSFRYGIYTHWGGVGKKARIREL